MQKTEWESGMVSCGKHWVTSYGDKVVEPACPDCIALTVRRAMRGDLDSPANIVDRLNVATSRYISSMSKSLIDNIFSTDPLIKKLPH